MKRSWKRLGANYRGILRTIKLGIAPPVGLVPGSRTLRELTRDFGPIVQDSGVEVSAIRLGQRARLGVQTRLEENGWISKGSVQLARKHGSKVDNLLRVVVEHNTNGVRTDVLESLNTVDRMGHQELTWLGRALSDT
jgi:hypothetical protein